jgi:hypothetical protein
MERDNIDVDKLAKEAEAGHGHYIRSMLDQVSYEEQIHIVHQMTNLSRERTKLAGCPKIEFVVPKYGSDANSGNGYSNIELYRVTPGIGGGPFFEKNELIYESSLNLTTGERTAADNNR